MNIWGFAYFNAGVFSLESLSLLQIVLLWYMLVTVEICPSLTIAKFIYYFFIGYFKIKILKLNFVLSLLLNLN